MFPEAVVRSDQLSQQPKAYFVYRPESQLIYLQRWYRMEAKVGAFVRERLSREPSSLPTGFETSFQQFFPLEGLDENPWQAAACLAALRHDFSVITGGPGTGKTFALMRRVQRLIQADQVPPERILVVTLTRTAADDLRQSLAELNVDGADEVNTSTLHSLCFLILLQESLKAF